MYIKFLPYGFQNISIKASWRRFAAHAEFSFFFLNEIFCTAGCVQTFLQMAAKTFGPVTAMAYDPLKQEEVTMCHKGQRVCRVSSQQKIKLLTPLTHAPRQSVRTY